LRGAGNSGAERRLTRALRAFAGFAAGLALWALATPAYNRVLAGFAEPVVRLLERPRATRLYAEDRRIVVDRSDFPSTSDRPSLPADDLTFDVILLLTLAGTTKGLFRDRAMRGLALACCVLFGLHVGALVVSVQAFYATQLGAWSAAHYGAFARNLWGTAAHFWRLAGCFAAPFLLWWLLIRPAATEAPAPGAARKGNPWRRRRKG
jgi:hypothetical protein